MKNGEFVMRRFWKQGIAPVALAIAVLTFATAVSIAAKPGGGGGGASYDVVRLAYPGAATASTESLDLNDHGNVVGTYRDANDVQYGYYYEHATQTYRSLDAGVTVARINQLNALVGSDDDLGCGLYWSSPIDPDPTPLLPLLGVHTHSRANAINDDGIIIGNSYIPEVSPAYPPAIVVWRIDAEGAASDPVVLPYPAGDSRGSATALTEQTDGVTVIVGSTGDAESFPIHAVQWSVILDGAGKPQLLDGPNVLSSDYAQALGINTSLSVVGQAVFTEGGAGWPYLKPADLPLVPLAGIPKATFGAAKAINDAGQIVGYQWYQSRGASVFRAVLWTSPFNVIDLNSKVALGRSESLTLASDVNSQGDVLATINGNTPCLLIAK
jgi:hypothetical protein